MIDLTKPVQTRDGQEVRFYNADTLDGAGIYPLHGAIEDGTKWVVAVWTGDGKFYDTGRRDGRDLVNIPVKRSGWINVYPCSGHPGSLGCLVHETEGEAKKKAVENATQVYIEW